MNEERHLAKEGGYESPICDDYDASTKSYHGNLLHILNNQGKGFEVFRKKTKTIEIYKINKLKCFLLSAKKQINNQRLAKLIKIIFLDCNC